ncbi:DUF1152 domain-containing protein [Streptomyces sp. ME01-24h]|nr:DUF1152 domain-containing protein [Streptomyces sp. ME01-24h]
MTRLIVAAGGGGDAVAAAMLDAALYGAEDPAVILTYAWDRLIVDPVPGPRSPADFTGLRQLTPSVYAVPADAEPVAPAGSTLPRLAAELPHTLALIDPRRGAVGLAQQLEELIAELSPESVDLLDVGGDILARGDEATLKSPLADALTLAACAQLKAPVRLLIAGPGLDGEIPAGDLQDSLGRAVHTFTADQVTPVSSVLEWHPSEATAMLAAAARGVRGLCEIRDAGLPVPLTDESPTAHEVDIDDALHRNRLSRALLSTNDLEEAEQHSREICGYSEIDYERNKALWLSGQRAASLDADIVLSELSRFETEARSRGITHTTFRRLTEVLGLDPVQRSDFRSLLITNRPDQYAPPLWKIPACR